MNKLQKIKLSQNLCQKPTLFEVSDVVQLSFKKLLKRYYTPSIIIHINFKFNIFPYKLNDMHRYRVRHTTRETIQPGILHISLNVYLF